MKKFLALSAAALMLGVCLSFAVSAENCPYDDDFKYALKKALIDYYANSGNSVMQPGEVRTLLSFYLSKGSVTDADCSQNNINSLIEKAESGIPDSVLSGVGKSITEKCEVCPDGTVCSEKNAKDQTCTCKDVDSDGKSEYCFLKPINPPIKTCEVCPDGTVCDDQNAKGQDCICKDVNSDDKFEFCYLWPLKPTPPVTCSGCSDGTACGKKNKETRTCQCQDTDNDTKYDSCLLGPRQPVTCSGCEGGTLCGKKNIANWTCECTDTDNDSEYDLCELKKPGPTLCKSCSDGTVCGKSNSNGQPCECKGGNGDYGYEICELKPTNIIVHYCNKCADGTGCWKCNGGSVCACKPQPTVASSYYSCWMVATCNKCSDEVACGETDGKGNYCVCGRKQDNGGYYTCKMECSSCGATPCGRTASLRSQSECVCRLPSSQTRGKYLECMIRCGSCSDGTRCGQRNINGAWCTCSGIEFTTQKYQTCQLGVRPGGICGKSFPASNTGIQDKKECALGGGTMTCNNMWCTCKCPTTTTTIAPTTTEETTTTQSTTTSTEVSTTASSTTTTTSPQTADCETDLDCYKKLGLCWTCPDGGGQCLTLDVDIHACPDCTGYGDGFECYNAKYGSGPYCCFKTGDTFNNATCNDGTPVNTCSKIPGLYCNTPIDELKPWPACNAINCSDSDGGKNIAKYGECSDVVKYYSYFVEDDKYTDQCNDNTITETYCESNQCKQGDITCPAGAECTDGRCVAVTTTTTTPGATTTTGGATTTTSSTTTTTTPKDPLTAANLLKCMRSRNAVLKTNTPVCPHCREQKAVFYNEQTAPVGPGKGVYDAVAKDGSSGIIPRWEYTLNGKSKQSGGCHTFVALNTMLQCNLEPVAGHTYVNTCT